MNIECPHCHTTYGLPDGSIGEEGRQVKCAKCGENWHAMPESPDISEELDQSSVDDMFSIATDDMASDEVSDSSEDTQNSDQDVAKNEPEMAETDSSDDEENERPKPDNEQSKSKDVEDLANRKNKKPSQPKHNPPRHDLKMAKIAAIFIGLCTLASGLFFKEYVVKSVPDTAGLYELIGMPVNLRGIEFANVSTQLQINAGRAILKVEGDLINIANQEQDIPAIRLSLLGAQGDEVYAWSIDPKELKLRKSDSFRFETELSAPPSNARQLRVRFIQRKTQTTLRS